MKRQRRLCLALLVLTLAPVALAGCGPRVIGHRTDPVAPPSKAPGLQERILEVREQSALGPQEPYWPFRLGEMYFEADSTAQAEAALLAALERDGHYAPALSLLSKLYFDTGRHQQAVSMLDSLRSRPEGFPGGVVPDALMAGLALHYDALGRPDLARELVTTLRPDRKDLRSAMVYVTLRGERPDSAAAPASAVLADGPRNAANQNNYGITRLRAGEPVAARKAFLAAIELDPGLAGPYYNLAILEKYYLFDDEAAARWLEAYRSRSSQDPDSLFGALQKREPKLAEEGPKK